MTTTTLEVLKVIDNKFKTVSVEIDAESQEEIYWLDVNRFSELKNVLKEDLLEVINLQLDNYRGLPRIGGYDIPKEDWK